MKASSRYLKEHYPHSWGRRHKPISEDELIKRLAMIPADTRDLTARIMGDPIPGDKRREVCKNTEPVNSVEEVD